MGECSISPSSQEGWALRDWIPERAQSLMLGALLVAEVIEKDPGNITEMLWACHISSLCLCVGLLLGARPAVAVALLFTLCVGLPTYLVDLVFGGEATGLSVREATGLSAIEHIATPLLAYEGMRHRDWPSGAVATTMGIGLALFGVCRLFTPPDLNINLVFTSWQTLENHFPGVQVTIGSLLLLWWVMLWAGNAFLTRHFETVQRSGSWPWRAKKWFEERRRVVVETRAASTTTSSAGLGRGDERD